MKSALNSEEMERARRAKPLPLDASWSTGDEDFDARIHAGLMQRDDLLAALKLVEFGSAVTHRKCVACSGWDVGPNGETPRAHTERCPVRIALAKVTP